MLLSHHGIAPANLVFKQICSLSELPRWQREERDTMISAKKWPLAILLVLLVTAAGQVSMAQPYANLDHDIVDENNVPFDMNDLAADRPLVLAVSSGT